MKLIGPEKEVEKAKRMLAEIAVTGTVTTIPLFREATQRELKMALKHLKENFAIVTNAIQKN